MAKFFIKQEDFFEDYALIKGEDMHHLSAVLRMKKDDVVEVAVCGKSFEGSIEKVASDFVRVKIVKSLLQTNEAPLEIYLLCGITKGEKMDWMTEKATELGVKEIIPVFMKRCVVQLDQKQAGEKQKRWQRIANAAAAQCRRSLIPQIDVPCSLQEALEHLPSDCPIIVLWEKEQEQIYKEALKAIKGDKLAIVIGAEGGIDCSEIEILLQAGAKTVTVGRRVLRAETAVIAALAMAAYELGDLGGES